MAKQTKQTEAPTALDVACQARNELEVYTVELKERLAALEAERPSPEVIRQKVDIQAQLTAAAAELFKADGRVAAAEAAAKAEAERAADRERALELRQAAKRFRAHGHAAHRHVVGLVAELQALKDAHDQIIQLGAPHPRWELVEVHGHAALLTALGATLWGRRFERLAPGQRKQLDTLVDQFSAAVERNYIVPLIGEAEQTTEAA